ncbi:Ameloblastin, partial [Tupaia chinensis]
IPLCKMKDLILILCLLEMCFAVPMFPQQPGTPGMASLSLEPSLQPQQPGLKPFLQPTAATAIQATAQKGGLQPPIRLEELPLKQAELPALQQQVAPADKPPKPEGGRGGPMAYGAMFPGFGGMRPSLGGMPHNPAMGGDFTLEFASPVAATKGPEKGEGGVQGSPMREPTPANPENPELLPEVGGRGGPMAYGAMFPGFGGMRPSLGGMPHNPAMGGDFTLEFDSPVAATKGPEKGEGGVQGSPMLEANPANPENPELLPEVVPGAHAGLLALPKDDIPSLTKGSTGQRMGPSGVTPAAADPLMTPELADDYGTYGVDVTTPMGLQEEATMDTTMTPDSQQTSMPGIKAQEPQVMHDAWHFQEP